MIGAFLLNASVATRYFMAGDDGLGIVFAAYAIACLGFLLKGMQ
jgi:hypothetical protein